MKKIFLFVFVFASLRGFSQKIDLSQVPAVITDVFNKQFAGVQDVKWEKEKGNYEANFKQKGEKMAALFDKSGKWLETETEIAITALPSPVKNYIAKNYTGKKTKEAAILKMANGDTNYEAEVSGSDLIFDANGRFIKSVKD